MDKLCSETENYCKHRGWEALLPKEGQEERAGAGEAACTWCPSSSAALGGLWDLHCPIVLVYSHSGSGLKGKSSSSSFLQEME